MAPQQRFKKRKCFRLYRRVRATRRPTTRLFFFLLRVYHRQRPVDSVRPKIENCGRDRREWRCSGVVIVSEARWVKIDVRALFFLAENKKITLVDSSDLN